VLFVIKENAMKYFAINMYHRIVENAWERDRLAGRFQEEKEDRVIIESDSDPDFDPDLDS
jgi:hypothetical protein